MNRIEVVQDQTSQKVWFRAPEGRPAATPSVGLKDNAGTVVTAAATTYVTIDPVTTTLSAAAAKLSSTVTLTSVTGIRMFAWYRIKNALQQIEDVRVIGIDSTAKIVYLDEPLRYAYASADTFFSCEFYRTLQAAEVEDLAELSIATATYLVTSEQTAPLLVPYDVVLHPLANRNPLSPAVLRRLWPDLTGQEWDSQKGEDFAPQRTEAWNRVMEGVYQQGKRPAMVVSAEMFERWALVEFAVILQEGGLEVLRGMSSEGALTRLDAKLAAAKSGAIATITWYDATEDESRDEETEGRPLPTHLVA